MSVFDNGRGYRSKALRKISHKEYKDKQRNKNIELKAH